MARESARAHLSVLAATVLLVALAPSNLRADTGCYLHDGVSMRADHALGLTEEARVLGWGAAHRGQLGPGGATTVLKPRFLWFDDANLLGDIESVAAGAGHSLFLSKDGRVLAVGAGERGQLGHPPLDRHYPVYVPAPDQLGDLGGVTSIAAGSAHGLALIDDGRVVSWGANGAGQLGHGTVSSRSTPSYVLSPDGESLLSDVIQVVAGGEFSLAVTSAGELFAWGAGQRGQLGNSENEDSSLPVVVPVSWSADNPNSWQVVGGSAHVLLLDSDGGIWAWGEGRQGQLGLGDESDRAQPTRLSTGANGEEIPVLRAIGAGAHHSLASNATELFTWGRGAEGQLGPDSPESSSRPWLTSIDPGGVSWSLGGGQASSYFGRGYNAWSWGAGQAGQLGDGLAEDSDVPRWTAVDFTIEDEVSGPGSAPLRVSKGSRGDLTVSFEAAEYASSSLVVGLLHELSTERSTGGVYAEARVGPVEVPRPIHDSFILAAAQCGSDHWFTGRATEGHYRRVALRPPDSDDDGTLDPWDLCPWHEGEELIDIDLDGVPEVCTSYCATHWPSGGSAAGGDWVVLQPDRYRDFADVTEVWFGGSQATDLEHISTRRLMVKSPRGVDGTAVDVRVVAGDEPVGSCPAPFRYGELDPTFHFATLRPTAGSAEGGDVVTIIGSGFDEITEVDFCGRTAVMLDRQPTQLLVRTPVAPAYDYRNCTVRAFFTDSSPRGLGTFEYDDPLPDVTVVTGAKGSPAAGGRQLELGGYHLQNATKVEFRSLDGTVRLEACDPWWYGNGVQVVTPEWPTDLLQTIEVEILVGNDMGWDATSALLPDGRTRFRYHPNPVLRSAENELDGTVVLTKPDNGVLLRGDHFVVDGESQVAGVLWRSSGLLSEGEPGDVSFVSSSVEFLDDGVMRTWAPWFREDAFDLGVRTSATSEGCFSLGSETLLEAAVVLLIPPQPSSSSPSHGGVSGGRTVTVRGRDLEDVRQVKLGGIEQDFLGSSYYSVQFRTVAAENDDLGPLDLVLRTAAGTPAVLEAAYTFVTPMRVDSVAFASPSCTRRFEYPTEVIPVGAGSPLEIRGANFTSPGGMRVTLGDGENARGTTILEQSDDRLLVEVSEVPPDGPAVITVHQSGVLSERLEDVWYPTTPHVESTSPRVIRPTLIYTIEGEGFLSEAGELPVVHFDGVPSPSVTATDVLIEAEVPELGTHPHWVHIDVLTCVNVIYSGKIEYVPLF